MAKINFYSEKNIFANINFHLFDLIYIGNTDRRTCTDNQTERNSLPFQKLTSPIFSYIQSTIKRLAQRTSHKAKPSKNLFEFPAVAASLAQLNAVALPLSLNVFYL